MADKKYLNIPLDAETYRKVKEMAQARGFGERGQGAVVRLLVNASYEAWLNLPATEAIAPLRSQPARPGETC